MSITVALVTFWAEKTWMSINRWMDKLWWCIPSNSAGKESDCNAGDLGSIPGLGKYPEGGHGNPFQYSCLENHHEPGRLQSMGLQRVGHMVYMAYIKEYYSIIKKNEELRPITTWRNLKNMAPSERSRYKRSYAVWFHLHEITRINKSIQTEHTLC